MRILITGGHGTVGAGLRRELLDRDHDVVACDISHATDEVGFSVGTDVSEPRYARCDVSDFRQIERVVKQLGPFDYVYHCAAEFGRWNGEDFYESLWRTNAIGTKNLIRLQEQIGFRLVHFSSSEVYGDWDGTMSEDIMDDHEVRQLNDYALSKWVNEIQVENSALQYGTESVVVRLFNTYGPGEYYSPYRSVNSRFLYCAMNGLPFTVYRGHERTSTYLADTTRTLANIIDAFRPGETYNIGGSELHTIEELAKVTIEVTDADPALVTYEDSERMTTRTKRPNTSKSRDHLGHTDSYSLQDGMALTAEWMRGAYAMRVTRTSG